MKKNLFINPFEKQPEQDPMAPTYIKPDGTKVIEQKNEFGLTVYELCPDTALIMRSYDNNNKLVVDYMRHKNFEVGHNFDEFGNIIYQFESAYDEHNKLVRKNEYDIEYYDNGKKKAEIITTFPNQTKTYLQYDINGKRTEKIIERGTVKTWYDENDKAFKREINRGSGGNITEEL